ncbi:hypothetical protein CsatA_000674 [Cannabis sativa]
MVGGNFTLCRVTVLPVDPVLKSFVLVVKDVNTQVTAPLDLYQRTMSVMQCPPKERSNPIGVNNRVCERNSSSKHIDPNQRK